MLVAVFATSLTAGVAAAPADFVSLCEANQVYDTGKLTTDRERQVCRCIAHRLDPAGEQVAIEVFQKVLAARRDGLGLHPSQLELEELVALMSFADNLRACDGSEGRAAF